MMIVVVGEESCIGKIRALLDQEEEVLTPLQQKLEKLASDIGKFGLYSALLILTVLLVRFGIERGISR
jgi:magnesium-transporting ATPase (P-type)